MILARSERNTSSKGRENLVSRIWDHEVDASKPLLHREVASLLGDPCGVRVPGDAEDRHPPRRDADREQHVERPKQDRLHGEEVHRARIAPAWGRRNWLQLGPSRRGAGPRPFARSTVRILVAETLMSSLTSSPRIRMQPHRGFSLPICRMRSRTSPEIGGLPPRDLRRKVHFLRTSSRCHRMERLRADQERGPPSAREDPADRGHEQAVATAKLWPCHLRTFS
jgi:hypothetical protein